MRELPDGLGRAVTTRPLGGGSIARTVAATLEDGREVVVKEPPTDATLEAEGLEALRDAGAPVPAVLAAERDVLVVELVRGTPAWDELGAALATVHRDATADAFGWHRDNVIGPLPQRNDPDPHWPRFYAERRVRPWLGASALPADVRRRLERALEGPLLEVLDHDVRPSLVHGDLWSGNVIDGRWLIDPAVHHADRELDLAFAEVFGGFPAPFWRGYADVWPLDDGWEERRPVMQLHHLLVHVELFGAGYVGAVAARLDRLGW